MGMYSRSLFAPSLTWPQLYSQPTRESFVEKRSVSGALLYASPRLYCAADLLVLVEAAEVLAGDEATVAVAGTAEGEDEMIVLDVIEVKPTTVVLKGVAREEDGLMVEFEDTAKVDDATTVTAALEEKAMLFALVVAGFLEDDGAPCDMVVEDFTADEA